MPKKSENQSDIFSSIIGAPINAMKYAIKNPIKSTVYLLTVFGIKPAEAVKINKVSYATYNLGGIELFNPALQNLHAGLHFHLEDGSYRELHYDGRIKEANDCSYEGRRRRGLYEIGGFSGEYDNVKNMIETEFHGKYALGKRDCWKLVEWFSENKMGKNKKDLNGPIGDRNGIGNGFRHISDQVGQVINHNKKSLEGFGKDIAKETNTFFKNPVNAISEGAKHPEKVAKHIIKAVEKTTKPIENQVREIGEKACNFAKHLRISC